MRVTVTHSIGDLAADLAQIPAEFARRAPGIVEKNVREGERLARGFARGSAGPHGTSYYKRISSEMTGPLTGEWGPHGQVAGNAVGGGWRNGPPNTDQARSADVIGPQFAGDIGDMVDGLFWL